MEAYFASGRLVSGYVQGGAFVVTGGELVIPKGVTYREGHAYTLPKTDLGAMPSRGPVSPSAEVDTAEAPAWLPAHLRGRWRHPRLARVAGLPAPPGYAWKLGNWVVRACDDQVQGDGLPGESVALLPARTTVAGIGTQLLVGLGAVAAARLAYVAYEGIRDGVNQLGTPSTASSGSAPPPTASAPPAPMPPPAVRLPPPARPPAPPPRLPAPAPRAAAAAPRLPPAPRPAAAPAARTVNLPGLPGPVGTLAGKALAKLPGPVAPLAAAALKQAAPALPGALRGLEGLVGSGGKSTGQGGEDLDDAQPSNDSAEQLDESALGTDETSSPTDDAGDLSNLPEPPEDDEGG